MKNMRVEIRKNRRIQREDEEMINAGETESRVHILGWPGAGQFPLDLFTRSFQQADGRPGHLLWLHKAMGRRSWTALTL